MTNSITSLLARLEALTADCEFAESRYRLARRIGKVQRGLENRDRRIRARLQGRATRRLKQRLSGDLLRRSRDRRKQRLRSQKGQR